MKINGKIFLLTILIISSSLLNGCNNNQMEDYTLYRNSPIDSNMRVHIATFNSKEKSYGSSNSESYNNYNCQLAVTLFNSQPNVASNFWCEKGAFKK